MEPARPISSVPIDVEPQNPFGEQLRTKIRWRAQLGSRRYRQITTTPNQPPIRPVRSPGRAVRIPAIPALRNPSDERLRMKSCLQAQLRGRRYWQITTSLNRPTMCPARSPRPALRGRVISALRNPYGEAVAIKMLRHTQLPGRRYRQSPPLTNWTTRRPF